MSQYGTDARKSMAQIADEPFHRLLLCRCPGVGDAAVLVQTALITDADGVTVPAPGVGAHALYRATRVDDAIQRDIVMVADVSPSVHLHVVVAQLLQRISAVATRCTTVHHYHVDLSHPRLLPSDTKSHPMCQERRLTLLSRTCRLHIYT